MTLIREILLGISPLHGVLFGCLVGFAIAYRLRTIHEERRERIEKRAIYLFKLVGVSVVVVWILMIVWSYVLLYQYGSLNGATP